CNGPAPTRSSWFSRGNGTSALRRGNLPPRPRAHGRRDRARAPWLLGEPPDAVLEEPDLERVASRPRHHRADRDLDRLARGKIARHEPRLALEHDRARGVAPARLHGDAPARVRREARP